MMYHDIASANLLCARIWTKNFSHLSHDMKQHRVIFALELQII